MYLAIGIYKVNKFQVSVGTEYVLSLLVDLLQYYTNYTLEFHIKNIGIYKSIKYLLGDIYSIYVYTCLV